MATTDDYYQSCLWYLSKIHEHVKFEEAREALAKLDVRLGEILGDLEGEEDEDSTAGFMIPQDR